MSSVIAFTFVCNTAVYTLHWSACSSVRYARPPDASHVGGEGKTKHEGSIGVGPGRVWTLEGLGVLTRIPSLSLPVSTLTLRIKGRQPDPENMLMTQMKALRETSTNPLSFEI